MDAADRVRQLLPGDALRHVAARAGADHGDHVLGRIGHGQGQEAGRPAGERRGAPDHLHAAAVRHVHVEQDDVGRAGLDGVDGRAHGPGLAGDLEQRLELRPHAGAEELVIVDDQHARPGHPRSSSTISTSVPDPGELDTRARPPFRSIRPMIDSRRPRRSAGTASGSKPGPRSRTNTWVRRSWLSAYTSTGDPPPNFAALVMASRAAATTASCAWSPSLSPPTTPSTGTPWSSSTSAAAASSALARRRS